MTREEFTALVNQTQIKNPLWFQGERESKATAEQIATAQNKLTIVFPDDYCWFLREYGGGYFAHTNIFSVSRSPEWDVVEKNKFFSDFLDHNFIAITDDEAGGYYGFICRHGKCQEDVYYYYPSEGEPQKKFDSVLGYIAKVGLQSTKSMDN